MLAAFALRFGVYVQELRAAGSAVLVVYPFPRILRIVNVIRERVSNDRADLVVVALIKRRAFAHALVALAIAAPRFIEAAAFGPARWAIWLCHDLRFIV